MQGSNEPTSALLRATISKTFPQPVGTILSAYDFKCIPGEIVALVGPSGCGKSTFLNLIIGLESPDSLSILSNNAKSMGYAFQLAELLPWRDVKETAYLETDLLGIPREQVKERVVQLLRLTRLIDNQTLLPNQMSVGMRQRLQLVRVCARPVELLLLDEPLSAVDQPLRVQIAEELRHILKHSNSATIWVTHDPREAVAVADRVIVLAGKPMRTVLELQVNRAMSNSNVSINLKGFKHEANATLEDQAVFIRNTIASEAYSYHTSVLINGPIEIKQSPFRLISKDFAIQFVLPWIPLLLILVLWDVLVNFQPGLRFYISSPDEWLPLLVNEFQTGIMWKHLSITLKELSGGMLLGVPAGILIGYLAGHSRLLSSALRPSLAGLTAVPLFVLAPAFILWFGIGEAMKVALAAISCFPFVAFSVQGAVDDAKSTYYRYLLKAGAKPSRLFMHLILPHSLEAIFLSIRPAAVAALTGAFLGEFVAAEAGLGYYVIYQASRYHIAEVLVGVSTLFFTAVVLEFLGRFLASKRIAIVQMMHL